MIELYHGDCLEVMDQLIREGIKFDAIITDPPYGVTSCEWDAIIPFKKMWERLKDLRKDTTPILLFGSESFSSFLRISNIKEYKYDWIWIKNTGTGIGHANKRPMKYHESVSVFYRKQPIYNKQKTLRISEKGKKTARSGTKGSQRTVTNKTISGDIPNVRYYNPEIVNPRSYLEIESVPNCESIKVHPTQKPVKLMEYLIKTYTKENDLVLDFTMGSGTTGVACLKTNRDFIGIELDKEYYETAKRRINYQVSFNKLSKELKDKKELGL